MSVIIRNDHRIIAAIIGAYYCHYLLQSIHWLRRSGFETPARRKDDAHFVCETNYLGKPECEEFLSPSCLLWNFAHFPLSLRLHTFCFYLRGHATPYLCLSLAMKDQQGSTDPCHRASFDFEGTQFTGMLPWWKTNNDRTAHRTRHVAFHDAKVS